MIAIDEALDIVLRHTRKLPPESVALDACPGRVLAEDVLSDVDMPPFDRAAMDGYALRAEDSRPVPATLEVIGEVRAGQVSERGPGPGQAVQIMTGAPVPAGADAVLQVERTHALADGRVELRAAVEVGTNVARRGVEVRAGDIVLRAGAHINAATVAVLASVGQAQVKVGGRPRVGIVVTGDELVDVHEVPGPGRIRNSNGYAVAALARRAGAEVTTLEVVPDVVERIEAAVARGLLSDVLVISGGVSEGVYDLVEPVLDHFGVDKLFERVAIKPGAPLIFAVKGETLVFGLPGNPVSAQVTFDVFVRTALLRMQGATCLSRPRVEVELLGRVKNSSGRKAHLPALVRHEGGRLVARPVRSAGSADVRAHARANALVVLDADRRTAEAGEVAPALLLEGFLDHPGLGKDEDGDEAEGTP